MGNFASRRKLDNRSFKIFELKQALDDLERQYYELEWKIESLTERIRHYGLRLNEEARRSLAKKQKYESRQLKIKERRLKLATKLNQLNNTAVEKLNDLL